MQRRNGSDNILAYILCLLIYVPSNTIGSLLRVAVAVFVYALKSRYSLEQGVAKLTRYILISPFVPLVFVILMERGVNATIVIHEVMRMVYCAFLIMAVSKFSISFKCLYLCCVLAIIPNLLIQILQYNGQERVFNLIRQYYMDPTSLDEWTHLELARGKGADFRSGSIFLNPNVYMVITLLSMVVFCKKDKDSPGALNYIMMGCSIVSCFLTGSRTATIVQIIILGIYLTKYSSRKSRRILILGIAGFILIFGSAMIFGSRSFTFAGSESGSLTAKIRGFIWYWTSTQNYPLYWIVGSLGSRVAVGIDCEWGHLYTWYGLFGIFWYIMYLKLIKMRNPYISFYSKPITYICGLVAITASVMLCMPLFSFVSLLQFSDVSDKAYETEES